MTRITADISVSLDGFVTGPDPSPDNGLGAGGEVLHTWAFSDDPDDRRFLHEGTARSGAVIVGKPVFVAAERDLDIDRDAPDLRRLPVIR
jgi:hypothetical protein